MIRRRQVQSSGSGTWEADAGVQCPARENKKEITISSSSPTPTPTRTTPIDSSLASSLAGVREFGMDSGVVDTQISSGFSSHHQALSSPTSTTSLSHVHISEAVLKSEDSGATLDFSHKSLTDVGEYGAEELATIGREHSMEDESSLLRCALSSPSACREHLTDHLCLVARITLASNRLATIPMAFALLSRLRYLNLKNNCFTMFPDVVSSVLHGVLSACHSHHTTRYQAHHHALT
jgi:hypothetical protein